MSEYTSKFTGEEIDARLTAVPDIAENIALLSGSLGFRRKNLLKNTAISQEKDGITFTVNEDGSVTANGTATEATALTLHIFSEPQASNTYILSGAVGGSDSTYYLDATDENYTTEVHAFDGDIELWNKFVRIRAVIKKGYTAENLTFFPMLRYSEISDGTFEPYKPSIEERLAALEA